MSYVLGKVYKVDTLVFKKNGKGRMKKLKLFDLLDANGYVVEKGIAKKERPFYKEFIALADQEGATL